MPTMLVLPWCWSGAPRPPEALVFASRLDGTGFRRGWRLLIGGMRLYLAVLGAPGALGVSVRAHPIQGRYYTLSMWRDQESLMSFAHGPAHRRAVRGVATRPGAGGAGIAGCPSAAAAHLAGHQALADDSRHRPLPPPAAVHSDGTKSRRAGTLTPAAWHAGRARRRTRTPAGHFGQPMSNRLAWQPARSSAKPGSRRTGAGC